MAQPNTAMSLEPLLCLARRQSCSPDGEGILSDKEFARMIGVSPRTVARWRAAGDILPWQAADEAATALGEWPGRVWGGEWISLDADVIEGTASKKVEEEIAKAMEQIGAVMAREAATMSSHEHIAA
jgi:hypothetical protein